jgi:hypothetical protein
MTKFAPNKKPITDAQREAFQDLMAKGQENLERLQREEAQVPEDHEFFNDECECAVCQEAQP